MCSETGCGGEGSLIVDLDPPEGGLIIEGVHAEGVQSVIPRQRLSFCPPHGVAHGLTRLLSVGRIVRGGGIPFPESHALAAYGWEVTSGG